MRSGHGIHFALNAFDKQSIRPGEAAGGAAFAPIPVSPDPFVAGLTACGSSTKIKFQRIFYWNYIAVSYKTRKAASVVLVELAINLLQGQNESAT